MNPLQSTPSPDGHPESISKDASEWLVRRDRGLTPTEQDDYVSWLTSDSRHAQAIAQQAKTLERMMQLYEWTPAHGGVKPNPDLFAPELVEHRIHRLVNLRSWRVWAGGLAAAAALVVGALRWSGPSTRPNVAVAQVQAPSFLHVNERQALPDGSRVELNDGAQFVVLYSEHERRVRLTAGEAHFTVWKDATRPFVVEVAGVEVVAVGTAFNVRLAPDQIEVLVTEGRVKVQSESDVSAASPDQATGAGPERQPATLAATSSDDLFVSMGERAVVSRRLAQAVGVDAGAVVTAVTSAEIAAELAWQAPRLQFYETRLSDAVAEFNRLNRHQLVIEDPELGDRRIGGNFRPDNVEGFVRLLGLTLEIEGEPSGQNCTALRRRR
jgi:transmembrane sensor